MNENIGLAILMVSIIPGFFLVLYVVESFQDWCNRRRDRKYAGTHHNTPWRWEE